MANAGVTDMFVTQISEHQEKNDLTRCLKDTGWSDGVTMTLTNISKFTELLYIIILDGKTRKTTLLLEFRTQDKFHSFVQKLKTTTEEKDGTKCLSSTPVAVAQKKDPDTEASGSSLAKTVKAKPKYYRPYCQRDDYTIGRCFQRNRHQKS